MHVPHFFFFCSRFLSLITVFFLFVCLGDTSNLMVWTVENGFRSCSCVCYVHARRSCFASPLILLFLTVCHKGHAHVECHMSGYCIISLFASLQLSIIHSMQQTLHDDFHWYLQLLINNHCCTYIYICDA